MEMPMATAPKKKRGRPRKTMKLDQLFQIRLDRKLSDALGKLCKRQMVASQSELLRQLLVRELRSNKLLDE